MSVCPSAECVDAYVAIAYAKMKPLCDVRASLERLYTRTRLAPPYPAYIHNAHSTAQRSTHLPTPRLQSFIPLASDTCRSLSALCTPDDDWTFPGLATLQPSGVRAVCLCVRCVSVCTVSVCVVC